MRFMVLVKASKASEAGEMPGPELFEAMGKFNQALVDAGVMEAGDGLKPSSQGARVRFSGDRRTVTKGPFGHTEELVAGYWIWNCASLDEAIEWARKCPNTMPGEDSDLEIRPVYAIEDFSTATPEIIENHAKLAAQMADQKG
jgi:hypothetical protein